MLYMIWIEFVRSVEETVSYRKVFIMDLIIFLAMFVVVMVFGMGTGIHLFVEGEVSEADLAILRFMGFVYWMFISSSLGVVSSSVIFDSKIGLLELRLRGAFKYRYLLIGEYASSMLTTAVISIIITVVAIIVLNAYSIGLVVFVIVMLLTLFITLIGMYGISLAIGGFALLHKRLGSLLTIISAVIFFIFNSTLMYQNEFLQNIPMIKALDISRNAYLGNSVNVLDLVYILVFNVATLVVGNYIFKFYEKKAILAGSIPIR